MTLTNSIPTPGGTDDPAAGAAATPYMALCDHVAKVIHDSVLQALALSMLQADLCRRGIEAGNRDMALEELSGIEPQLQSAVETLRNVIAELRAAAQADTADS